MYAHYKLMQFCASSHEGVEFAHSLSTCDNNYQHLLRINGQLANHNSDHELFNITMVKQSMQEALGLWFWHVRNTDFQS